MGAWCLPRVPWLRLEPALTPGLASSSATLIQVCRVTPFQFPPLTGSATNMASSRVYVGNLPLDIREREIEGEWQAGLVCLQHAGDKSSLGPSLGKRATA